MFDQLVYSASDREQITNQQCFYMATARKVCLCDLCAFEINVEGLHRALIHLDP